MVTQVNENIAWQKAKLALQAKITDTPKNALKSDIHQAQLAKKIKRQLQENNAVFVAHYYVDGSLQDLAEQSGGFVGDSLEMARFCKQHPAKTLVIGGVRFMAETAKILSPEKRVLVLDTEAECSLDISAPIDAFSKFCDTHPERTVVVYANTSAAVKARADWVVTSSIAVDVVRHLHQLGEKILWAPDKHLGHYIQQQTQADMLLWDGICIVHDTFKATSLAMLHKQHPQAAILVHPESPKDVIALADVVGSTTTLIEAATNMPNPSFIVATDNGILHKMKKLAPNKLFMEAPSAGKSAICESCNHCPWMALNDLEKLSEVLEAGKNEIFVDEDVRVKALTSTDRMLKFKQQLVSERQAAALV